MAWVVVYDISASRARTRVAKRLVAEGIRVQKSVFLMHARPKQAKRIVKLIAREIDPKTDSVCAWPLAPGWEQAQHCFPDEAAPLNETVLIA